MDSSQLIQIRLQKSDSMFLSRWALNHINFRISLDKKYKNFKKTLTLIITNEYEIILRLLKLFEKTKTTIYFLTRGTEKDRILSKRGKTLKFYH